MLQAEFVLTQVFDRPVRGRVLFEEIMRESLDLGRSGCAFRLASGVAAFVWNGWQASRGISGRLGVEYAEGRSFRMKDKIDSN